ncbi:MAG: hypothetical protein J6O01_07760 [Bacteroidales bacterium]|nr:hypothetical protein [Bacteroidales bacterium]
MKTRHTTLMRNHSLRIMIKSGLLFFVIIALSAGSCSKNNIPVPLTKVEYTGNQLRTDGYYYSIDDELLYLSVLYRDGFCIHTLTHKPDDFGPDTLQCIENKLLNPGFISKLKDFPSQIGVFKINDIVIEIEIWDDVGRIIGGDVLNTFSYYGKILNDTTFFVYKRVNNENDKTYTEDLTYHFVKYDSKPDSTNRFINSPSRPKLPRI